MHRCTHWLVKVFCLTLLAAPAFAQSKPATVSDQPQAGRAKFIKALIIDERLSALRREDDIHAPVLKRLRIGRAVYITSPSRRDDFYRVAVSRRTRGWIQPGAIALTGRAGEDVRVMKVIEETSDGLDRIALCRLLLEQFSHSRYGPRALLLLGE